jgi:hypothetical protein
VKSDHLSTSVSSVSLSSIGKAISKISPWQNLLVGGKNQLANKFTNWKEWYDQKLALLREDPPRKWTAEPNRGASGRGVGGQKIYR